MGGKTMGQECETELRRRLEILKTQLGAGRIKFAAMKKTTVRMFVVIIVCVPVMAILAPVLLNVAGYCYGKGRRLTEDEKFKYAISAYIEGRLLRSRWESDQYKYKSVGEFVSLHPACCYFGPIGGDDYRPISSIDRIFGFASDVVVISVEAPSGIQRYQVTLNSCGKVVFF